ncbi:phage protein [Sulfuriferula multivorans]|uniref:Phage protein n=1 Tax=Sulfuriferula multivorans TaxID=1559896 RepID=A0A401JF04_9PROT|nr:hypothetical protein [Sulfuriferula multivorans]GBL46212.1 phage protein [Sulfuriferula multivorans]
MTYQTGSFSTPDQLLSAIRSFSALNGWTENLYAANGTGNRLHINKGTIFLNFRSAVAEDLLNNTTYGFNPIAVTGVACSISTGYLSTSAWNAQPGSIAGNGYSGTFNHSASGTYHLFASVAPDMLFCVAEVSPGIINHLGGGMLTKTGTYPGGEWISGSYFCDGAIYDTASYKNYITPGSSAGHHLRPLPFLWSNFEQAPATQVHADYDTYTGFGYISNDADRTRAPWLTGPMLRLFFNGPASNPVANAFNGISPMSPGYVFGQRPSGFWSPLGYAPHLRFLNIANYSIGDIITLGSEQWMVFPGYQKDPTQYSFNYGYAVRYQP